MGPFAKLERSSRPGWHAPWARRSLLALILLLSGFFLISFAHAKAFWGDESLTFYTVHNRTLRGLLDFQASTPVVLEPPANDILLWIVSRIFGYSKMALRLPSTLFFLLIQWLVYRLGSALGGYAVGFLAAVALLVTTFVTYGAEARPYALLTALTVAAVFLWYRARTIPASRTAPLILLTVVVALAVTTQFYGFMVVIPVLAAEMTFCWLHHERPSWPVILALTAGLLALAIDLPFIRAVKAYQPPSTHQFNTDSSQFLYTYSWGFMTLQTYPWMHLTIPRFIGITLLIAIPGSFPSRCDWKNGAGDMPIRAALWAAFLAMTLFPLPALLIARLITHTYAPRYAIQCVVGLVVLLAVVLVRLVGRLPFSVAVVVTILGYAVIVRQSLRHLELQNGYTRQVEARYQISPPVRAFLANHPQSPIYLTIDECLLYPFFGDQAFDARVRCLYSIPREEQYNHSVMNSLTAKVMGQDTDMPLRTVSYATMRGEGEALLAFNRKPWLDWIPDSVAADGGKTDALGEGFGGDVLLIQYPDARQKQSSSQSAH